jgi:hypothetical protein
VLPAAVEAFEDESGEGEGRKIVGSALLGTWTALYLGNRALRRTSLSGGEGLLVLAGHAAGGLVALGVTYLLDGGDRASETVYLATSAGGAALGSLLTFNAVRGGEPLAGSPEQSAANRVTSRELTARARGRVSLSFDPSGLLLPVLDRVGGGSTSGSARSAALLTLRF